MELPQKNFIIYDADCGFCQSSINRLKKIIGDKIAYVPRQGLPDEFYNIGPINQNGAIRFFEHNNSGQNRPGQDIIHENYLSIYPDAKIYSSAHAVFRALSYSGWLKIFLALYYYLPLFSVISEAVYSVVARYRQELSGTGTCKI